MTRYHKEFGSIRPRVKTSWLITLLSSKKSLDHDHLSSNDFFMKTIILDYAEGKVSIISHEEIQGEDIEVLLTEKYNFRLDEIEWMTVNELKIETL